MYDVLDNLTQSAQGARLRSYTYDAGNRLTSVGGIGGGAFNLGYDVQGNVSNRNGVAYTFDYGNRLREVAGQENS